VLALDRADRWSFVFRTNKEDRVLTAILGLAEDLHRATEYDLTYLRA
jgi:hypothetical protein